MTGENSSRLFSKKMNDYRARVNKALDAELERKCARLDSNSLLRKVWLNALSCNRRPEK
jgi:hypothetical protein